MKNVGKKLKLKSKMTRSCMRFLFEKQMVLRAKRLMRVRKAKCLRSMHWVFALPIVWC